MANLIRLFFVLSLILCTRVASSQEPVDTVRFRDPNTGNERKRTGTIIEYSGKSLVMKVASGNEVSIPSGDVIEFETNWSDSHREANRLFAANDFADALLAYNKAILEKPPEWIVRRLMSRRVLCLSALNKQAEAADSFFRIVEVDSETQYYDTIPLNWQTQQIDASFNKQCDQWLKSSDVHKQLVAASWLLSTSSRVDAMRTLERLTTSIDARVALLATAQQWRATSVKATEEDTEKWRAVIERIPPELRAGPLYTCGSTMLKLDEDIDESVLLIMRVPLLYSENYQLAARCLFDSAMALRTASRKVESEIMLRELIAKYKQTRYAVEAQKLLELE